MKKRWEQAASAFVLAKEQVLLERREYHGLLALAWDTLDKDISDEIYRITTTRGSSTHLKRVLADQQRVFGLIDSYLEALTQNEEKILQIDRDERGMPGPPLIPIDEERGKKEMKEGEEWKQLPLVKYLRYKEEVDKKMEGELDISKPNEVYRYLVWMTEHKLG